MRATEIIRGVLDLIDQVECAQQAEPQPQAMPDEDVRTTGVDLPFKQIFDILSAERDQMYNNSPDPVVAGIDSVTKDAGGGLNGPKHPADIRANTVAMYPGAQNVR